MAEKKGRKKADKIAEETVVEETAAEEKAAEEKAAEEKAAEDTGEKEAGGEQAEADAEKERDMYLEMLKRERADFENFKKRNAAVASSAFQNGCADTLEKILPVLDNFERALAGSEESEDAFTIGIRMIYRQLMDSLASVGLKEIEALGKPFDPEFMNAVMQAPCEEGEEPGIVSEVFRKGYMLSDRIIRHAMVKVTN